MNPSAVAIFCEHIRPEASGSDTLIGILPDNLVVPGFPATVPNLGIYVRFHLNPDVDPGTLSYSLVTSDGTILAGQQIERSLIENVLTGAKNSGTPVAGIISRLAFQPFTVQNSGRLRVIAKIGVNEFVCGALNIDKTTAS